MSLLAALPQPLPQPSVPVPPGTLAGLPVPQPRAPQPQQLPVTLAGPPVPQWQQAYAPQGHQWSVGPKSHQFDEGEAKQSLQEDMQPAENPEPKGGPMILGPRMRGSVVNNPSVPPETRTEEPAPTDEAKGKAPPPLEGETPPWRKYKRNTKSKSTQK